MSKLLIVHDLKDENWRPALERWFVRYHHPEVLAQHPFHYFLYRCVPAPAGGENFGYYNYRVHEVIRDTQNREGENGLLAMTPQPGGCDVMDAIVTSLPTEPTEDFMGAEKSFDEHTVLRWLCVFRYPDGVDIAEADKWYLNVHVPEMMKTPGLNRYFSTKAFISAGSPLPQGDSFMKHDELFYKQWHRVTELWFDNGSAWTNGIIKNLPKLSKPEWATYDKYPFVIPGNEFISTFILERPDHDWALEMRSLYC